MYDENAVDRASEHSRSRITLPACALLLTCALRTCVAAHDPGGTSSRAFASAWKVLNSCCKFAASLPWFS